MQIIYYLTLVVAWLGSEVLSDDPSPVIRHLEIGQTHYVDSGQSHYGFTRQDNGVFKTVSVNKDKITVLLPDCTMIIRTWAELNSVDRKAVREAQKVISSAYKDFDQFEGGNDASMELFKFDHASNEKKLLKEVNKNGATLYRLASSDNIEYSDSEISLTGDKLAPELSRVFILKKSLTYVYENRFVIMKPRWCLFDDDTDLLQSAGLKY